MSRGSKTRSGHNRHARRRRMQRFRETSRIRRRPFAGLDKSRLARLFGTMLERAVRRAFNSHTAHVAVRMLRGRWPTRAEMPPEVAAAARAASDRSWARIDPLRAST